MRGSWRVRVEAPVELEDELAGRLWMAGSVGSWSEPVAQGRVRLNAFFEHDADSPPDLEAALADCGAGIGVVAVEAVAEQDWLAGWRAGAAPIEVGTRFLVDPREPSETAVPVDAGGRLLLRLPARTAFGVGSHESTRLAVELLERQAVAGRRVLDVGTGTGILALAALRLGAREVVALDLDPAAALLLPQYMALNRARFAAFVGSVRALAPGAGRGGRGFDLALVNVVPREIAPDLSALAAALRPGGAALFSGILGARSGGALERLARHGFREVSRREAGEWIAFATELAP